jgi:hypothetical protein
VILPINLSRNILKESLSSDIAIKGKITILITSPALGPKSKSPLKALEMDMDFEQ